MRVRWVNPILYVLVVAFCLLQFSDARTQELEGVIETLRFKEADIRVVLQAVTQKAIKDGARVNILVAPDVKGLITVDLENVDWQTALEAVLKTYDYGYEWVGKNIVLVDTLENLAEKRKKAQEAQVAEPLETRVFTLNFAKVADIQEPVERLLTARGRLTFDPRTNSLVITDTQSNMAMLAEAITSLDEITPQVLIEAKVIETNLDVTKKLGIRWNIGTTDSEPTTVISGSRRPHSYPFTTSSDEKYFEDPFPSNTAGFANGTLDATSLSAAMQILFEDTDTQILSEPKLTTLDNNTATIDVVTEDPIPNYTYNSETGQWEISGFEWLKYGVSLIVTPQINREGFVTLTVKPVVSENVGTRTFSSGSGTGATITIPILNTQTTTTKVMIKDGETLVIGGLIRDKTIETINRVPFLGDIPVLGYLFKHKGKTITKKNLLIFITPRIVTPERELAQN